MGLGKANLLKKIIDAIRELCKEVNLECGEKGMSMQAMDSSHVSLVKLTMKETVFEQYRADREKVLGVSMESLSKIFKLCDNSDSVTLKSDDDADAVQFVFESEKEDRISDFSLKLLDIEAENLGIPENQQYKGVIKMPSGELMKICRDLKEFGDSITMHCMKDGLKGTGMAPQLPEDMYYLIKKAVSIRKHLERNRKDKDSKFRLILVESRIHRLARYYKRVKSLPATWKYVSATASALVA